MEEEYQLIELNEAELKKQYCLFCKKFNILYERQNNCKNCIRKEILDDYCQSEKFKNDKNNWDKNNKKYVF